MQNKIYTVSYILSPDVPCIKITGKWLKQFNINIGDKLSLSINNQGLLLSKIPPIELNKLQKEKELKSLKKELKLLEN